MYRLRVGFSVGLALMYATYDKVHVAIEVGLYLGFKV